MHGSAHRISCLRIIADLANPYYTHRGYMMKGGENECFSKTVVLINVFAAAGLFGSDLVDSAGLLEVFNL